MSLVWIDGFDQYGTVDGATANVPMKSAGYIGDNILSDVGTLSTNTRTGVGMSKVCSYVQGFYLPIANLDKLITGFAINIGSMNYKPFFELGYNDFLGGQWTTFQLNSNANGALTALFTDKNGNIKGHWNSAQATLFENVWHYIELLYSPSSSGGGQIIVRVDGLAVLAVAGVATCSTDFPNSINIVQFPSFGANASIVSYDDWYLLHNDSVGLSTFLGDVVVHAIYPANDAGPNQMGQFGGSLGHFTTVNDLTAADDSAYVYSNTAGQQEFYGLSELPNDILSVLGVQIACRARKDSAGVSFFEIGAQLGSNQSFSQSYATTTQYVTRFMVLEQKPGGGNWTISDTQNLQIGFKTSAS
jgi:hypothetical protein